MSLLQPAAKGLFTTFDHSCQFTRTIYYKVVISSDSEEGGVNLLQIYYSDKGDKNRGARIFLCIKILKSSGFGRLSSSFFLPVSFGGESEGTPESLSGQKYGIILVWFGIGPQILSGLSSPAKSRKIYARLT